MSRCRKDILARLRAGEKLTAKRAGELCACTAQNARIVLAALVEDGLAHVVGARGQALVYARGVKPRKSKLERDVEKYLTEQVKKLGGEVRKVKWIGRDGAPDRLVMLPPRWRRDENYDRVYEPLILWVELKRPGGKATFPKNPHERKQQREHERMRVMGQRVEVIDSMEGVNELLGVV